MSRMLNIHNPAEAMKYVGKAEDFLRKACMALDADDIDEPLADADMSRRQMLLGTFNGYRQSLLFISDQYASHNIGQYAQRILDQYNEVEPILQESPALP